MRTDAPPEEYPEDPAALRAAIPALSEAVYLNTGATGPATDPVLRATTDAVRGHEVEAPATGDGYARAYDAFESAREAVAGFLNATPAEVALTHSTADGISRVAASLDLGPGDVVAHTDIEHPAGRLPWWNLEREGVERRVMETEAGRLDPKELRAAAREAGIVCFNSITWSHGTRLPVADLVDVAHDEGALVLVDAVQSFGQEPVDVREWGADVVVGAGHKWLLGPWGAGVLYVDPELADETTPAQVGYRSVSETDVAQPVLRAGTPRFEVGTANPAPYVGLERAIGVADAVGIGAVQDRIATLTDRLKAGMDDRLLSPRGYESGLVTFTVEGDPEAAAERLVEEGIVVRSLPFPQAVRASVHAFNTAEDVDALLGAL